MRYAGAALSSKKAAKALFYAGDGFRKDIELNYV